LAVALEVNAIVHSIVDIIVTRHERQQVAIEVACRSLLNDVMDRVVVIGGQPQDPWSTLVTRRSTYDKKTKASILNLIGEATGASAVKRLKYTPGFEKVTPTMVRKWRTPGPCKRRGKKVNLEFEAQIIGQMIYTEFENVNGVELALVKANVAHSYAVIQRAGEMVEALPQFKEDDKVQKLKFSRCWVRGFLRRAALRRRRVTATEKILPPVAEVRAKM
jgi:hypothetical protein